MHDEDDVGSEYMRRRQAEGTEDANEAGSDPRIASVFLHTRPVDALSPAQLTLLGTETRSRGHRHTVTPFFG